MKRDEAMALLDLDPLWDANEDAVRGAYARAVKADHPDHGGSGHLLAQLKQARDALLNPQDISPCVLCRGVGKVKGRFGAQVCTACDGTGDQP